MDTHRLLTRLSHRILIQFALAIILTGVAIGMNIDFLKQFYLENQQTNTGIILNSIIVGILVVGLFNLLWLLIRYQREESAVAICVPPATSMASGDRVRLSGGRATVDEPTIRLGASDAARRACLSMN